MAVRADTHPASPRSESIATADPDAFPEGWQLGAESWRFHREFFNRVGRAAVHREFGFIIGQIRGRRAERLGPSWYRVTLLDGAPLLVKGNWAMLTRVEPADYTPSPPKAAIPTVAAQPEASSPEAAPPEPTPAPARQRWTKQANTKLEKAKRVVVMPPPPVTAPVRQPEAAPPEPAVAAAQPPPKPPRTGTLSLNNAEAAHALAKRLRRFGVPDSGVGQGASP